MAQAVLLPAVCGRLHVSLPAQDRRPLRLSAALSSSSPSGVGDWVKATSSFFERDTRPIMLFDGVCNLCNGGVKFVRDNDQKSIQWHALILNHFVAYLSLRQIRFEALQSEAGKKLLQRSGRSPSDISSVVLVEKDRSYIKSEAVLKIMEYIDMPFPQLAIFLQFVPLFLRDFIYEGIANNRYTIFGRSESCEI